MVTIVKLAVLVLFMVLSSKSIGKFILEKCNKKTDETLGIGFLANLSLFWIITAVVMFFKLSTFYLNLFGTIYLIVSFLIIIRNIVKYKKLVFTKKEIIAILIAIILMILYCFFVHFGYIETYDSYFYSVLTNSASNTNNISVIDPYTGQENLQNYYKYISYYYQATYLGNVIGIENTYLVLVWVMTFMNYLFISITALTIVRITNNKYINNILSAFFFTFLTSIFRAPFNALHLVTMIIPLYCFKYAFNLFKRDNSSLVLLIISIISSITITSTSLFVITAFLYVIFAVASILDRREMYIKILTAGTPIILLASLYIYEALDSYLPIIAMFFVLTVLYLLFINKKILKIISIIGKCSIPLVLIILILLGNRGLGNKTKKSFIKTDAVDKTNLIVVEESEEIEEKFSYEDKDLILDYPFDNEKHSSSMQYIYSNNQGTISKLFILGTHSTVLYGGILALLLYGILKKEKQPEFIALYIYLIIFYNPLVRKGLSEVALNLEARVYLFFNTIFSLYGIKYFIEFLDLKIKNKKWYEFIKKYGSYAYILFVITSIILYISNFNVIDMSKYNLVYKVPTKIIEAEKFLEDYLDEKDKSNSRVFYTASTFNMSMIDEKVNEKIKIVNSKEYMGYFENPEKVLTDKLVISAFFDSEGQAKIKNNINEESLIEEEKVSELIEYFNIQYIALKKPTNEEFIKYIEENYEVIYYNEEIQILKVI